MQRNPLVSGRFCAGRFRDLSRRDWKD